MDYKDIVEEINTASNIAICTDELSSKELALAISALYVHLEDMGKGVSLILKDSPREGIQQVLDNNKIEGRDNVKPQDYTVSINYGEAGIERVTYDTDEKSGKIIFHIIPKEDDFNFDNIEFNEGGSKYDLTIAFDLDEFRDMGEVYDANDYLFKENKVITFGQNDIGDINVVLDQGQSYSEAVHLVLREFKEDITPKSIELLMEAMLTRAKILEGNAAPNSVKAISRMVEDGGDLYKGFRKQYFSKDYANMQLQIKLLQNVKVNREKRVSWSILKIEDLEEHQIDKQNLDVRGRIPFNVSDEFDVVLAGYEIEKNRVKIVIESNNPEIYSAKELAGVFGGKGGRSHSTCIANEMTSKTFEQQLFKVIHDLWGIDLLNDKEPVVSNSGGSRNVDNLTIDGGNSKLGSPFGNTLESEADSDED